MADPNLALLRAMALARGPLRERLVFVGGCATGLLVTNPELPNALPGIVAQPIRARVVLERLQHIASLDLTA